MEVEGLKQKKFFIIEIGTIQIFKTCRIHVIIKISIEIQDLSYFLFTYFFRYFI